MEGVARRYCQRMLQSAYPLSHNLDSNWQSLRTFENIQEKGEKTSNQHFVLFPIMFSTISQTEIAILAMFVMFKSFQFVVWERVNSLPNQFNILMTPKKEAIIKHRWKRQKCILFVSHNLACSLIFITICATFNDLQMLLTCII